MPTQNAIDYWYVNLASRPDRNDHACFEFAKAGIFARRFEAYTPDQYPGAQDKIARMKARTPGAIGCMMSQMAVMRTAQGSDRAVGVFEDDVVLCSDFKDRISYLCEHLPDDWDIAWLGSTVHVNPPVWHKTTLKRDLERTPDKRIFRAYGVWSTYAYLVRGSSVARVLDLCDQNMYRSDGIDHCMMLYVQPTLRTYCLMPGSTWQYDNKSNIGTGMTEFSTFKKLGPYVWADHMEDFDPDTFDWAEAAR